MEVASYYSNTQSFLMQMEELHISLELLTAENENRKESDVRMKVSFHNSMVLLTANFKVTINNNNYGHADFPNMFLT